VALQIDDPDLLDRITTILAEAGAVALDRDSPDAVIADHLPLHDGPPTIVLGEDLNGLEMLRAGASGVLPPTCTAADLLLAVEAATRGLVVMPRDPSALGSTEVGGVRASGKTFDPQRDHVLTARELEVLRLLAEGASNKLIARRLGISFHTAKFHVASIAEKLDATGRTDAVAQAVRLGLILL